jgi:hypothetical protein
MFPKIPILSATSIIGATRKFNAKLVVGKNHARQSNPRSIRNHRKFSGRRRIRGWNPQ